MVVLTGDLVDAVHVGRPHQMIFGNGQRAGPSVHLTRAGVDDFGAGVVMAARFEQRELRAAVDLEVGVRVAHAVDVADLAGEVEDDVLAPHQIVHRARLADVGDIQPQA
jgi:hypothetical protein